MTVKSRSRGHHRGAADPDFWTQTRGQGLVKISHERSSIPPARARNGVSTNGVHVGSEAIGGGTKYEIVTCCMTSYSNCCDEFDGIYIELEAKRMGRFSLGVAPVGPLDTRRVCHG